MYASLQTLGFNVLGRNASLSVAEAVATLPKFDRSFQLAILMATWN